jgi:hypothetical protein
MKTHQHYYLIGNKIKKGGEMPQKPCYKVLWDAEGDEVWNDWLSSLQPCEINSYESMLINKYLLQNGFVLNNNPNPIDVTDIVEERNHTQLLRNPPIDKFELFFKQPKEVDSEIEAVESQESIWLEILDIIVNKPSQIRLDICKQKFKIKRNI